MLKKERQAYIIHQINVHNKVVGSDLSQVTKVSEDTIRRDLQELADEGKVIKVHGGALSPSFTSLNYHRDAVYVQEQKRVIAQKAVSLIQPETFILTGGGTTIVELAKALPPGLRATFVSGSIPAILEYIQHPNLDVILLGDRINKSSKITVGVEAIAKINGLNADICFLGVNAINATKGITDNDWDIVQVKKAMIASSKLVVCVTIAEKLNSVQPIHICDVSDIDILITELPPDHPSLKPYLNAGMRVL